MKMKVNEFEVANNLTAQNVTITSSTDTTSITVVTAITTSESTQFQFNTQTIYFSGGVWTDLGAESTSTVTTSTS